MNQQTQSYLDALGALLAARREAGGKLRQEEESRCVALLDRLYWELSAEEQKLVEKLFPFQEP